MRTTLLIILLACPIALAAPRSSSSYSIPAEIVDAGGRPSTSASYSAAGSFHDATGTGTAASYTALHGYLGQTSGGLPSAFVSWQTAKFGNANLAEAAPLADPDKDGLNNVAEFAFGLEPNQASVAPLSSPATRGVPLMQFTSGALPKLEIAYVRRSDDSVEYHVESSTDLLSWNPTPTLGNPPPTAFGTGWQRATFLQFMAPPAPTRMFHRMVLRLAVQ